MSDKGIFNGKGYFDAGYYVHKPHHLQTFKTGFSL